MLNKAKKKKYYHKRISSISIDSKTIWNVLNQLMCLLFSVYFSDKIQKLSDGMNLNDNCLELSSKLITNKLMKNKSCSFLFEKVEVSKVEKLIRSSKDKPTGVDNLDVRLLKPVADVLALPICHIINLSLEKSICPAE